MYYKLSFDKSNAINELVTNKSDKVKMYGLNVNSVLI